MCVCRVGEVVCAFRAGDECGGVVVWVMCAYRVGDGCNGVVVLVVCACRVGDGCGRVVMWDGVVLICGVWFSLCIHGVGEGYGGIVVGMGGSYPVAGGLILWES